ncbi:MAG: LysM peptidoglycan-binding domain-containing protein [Nocardioides sp.]
MKLIRGLAALMVLLVLLTGVPVVLVATVGNPWPAGGLAEIELGSDRAILGLLAGIGWLFWAQMAACVAREVPAALTGLPALRVPLTAGSQQKLARVLVHSVVAIGIGSTSLWTGMEAPSPTPAAPETTQPTAVAFDQHPAAAAMAARAAAVEAVEAVEAAEVPHHRSPQHRPPHPSLSPTGTNDFRAPDAGPSVVVATGDTLWGLAERHLGAGERWREIADLNHGHPMGAGAVFGAGGHIGPGWTLSMPPDATGLGGGERGLVDRDQVVVRPGDTLSGIAAAALGDADRWPRLYAANRGVVGDDPDLILPGQVLDLTPPSGAGEGEQRPSDPLDHPGDHDGDGNGDGNGGKPNHQPRDQPGEDDSPAHPEREPGDDARPADPVPGVPRVTDPDTDTDPDNDTVIERGRLGDRAEGPVAETDAAGERSSSNAPGAVDGTVEGFGDAGDDQESDGLSVLRAILATAVCLAGGALTVLMVNRRRQFRERRAGRSIAPTPPSLVAVERAVAEAGAPAMETITFIDRALRHLANTQRVRGLVLPDLGAVVLDGEELCLLFNESVTGEPPECWVATSDALSWTLPRDTVLEAELLEQPAPYPALVSVGIDEGGRTWMLDLEAAGSALVGIAGDGDAAWDVIRFLVVELALNTWSEGVEVLVTGPLAQTVGFAPTRVTEVEQTQALRRAGLLAEDAKEYRRTLGVGLLDLRRDAIAVDSTGPVVVAVQDPGALVEEVADAMRRPGRSRVVVLHPVQTHQPAQTDQPVIVLNSDGTAFLPGWGTTVEPFRLPTGEAAAMAQLMEATRCVEDTPMPAADDSTEFGRFSTRDGALRESFTTPRDPEAEDASSLLPLPDRVYLEAAATTTEDLAALAPSVPEQVRLDVEALDPGLEEDLADWHDPDSPRPRVQVLGPVGVESRHGEVDKVANLGSTIELVVYLACQEHGVSPERAAEALGWSPRTVHNRARDARRLLGRRPDGLEWLPDATKSPTARTRGVAAYELHPDVLVAAELFRRLRLRAQARGAAGLPDLVAALSLVTGAPFDQLRRGGYRWLIDGDPLDHHLCHGVVDVAHLVVGRALTGGDTGLARWACEIAIGASPHEERPRLDLAAVTAAEHGSPDHVVREQVLDRVDADPTSRTEQVLDQRGWVAS